jgi:hypothetical protein
MKAFTDGKHHYLVLVPFSLEDHTIFYGDDKDVWEQRTISGSMERGVSFDRLFWDPRVTQLSRAALSFRGGKYTIQCEQRTTALSELPEAEGRALLARAQFHRPRWQRQAYFLARDETGRYYYVDRMPEPEGNHNFRRFTGPKGSLKLQKMINVVSDTEGDIFATRDGQLRLIAGQSESLWMQGKRRTKLVQVPVRENSALIYNELGIYTGEALGTPCDDW